MNLNLVSVALFGVGGVLVYSAVKGYDPRDVVRNALTGKAMSATSAKYVITPDAGSGAVVTPLPSAPAHPTTDPPPHVVGT